MKLAPNSEKKRQCQICARCEFREQEREKQQQEQEQEQEQERKEQMQSCTKSSTVLIKPASDSKRYGDISCSSCILFTLLRCGCQGEQGRYSVVTTALLIAVGDVALR